MKAVLNLSMIFLLGQSTLSQGSVLKSGSTESSVSINAPEVVISYVVTLREHVSRVFSSPEWIRDLHVRITGDQAEAKSPNPGRRIVEQNQERLHHFWAKETSGINSFLPSKVIDLDLSPQSDLVNARGGPWGLARISHIRKLGFSTFSQYAYDPDGGKGVNVYVLDTGVYTEHVEFEGRASSGTTSCGGNDTDENGSGTHNAGIIASKKYGVAKQAKIISVKVIKADGHGVSDDLIKGINWVINDHQKNVNSSDASFKGSVAFLNSEGISGAGNWDDIRSAISNASDAGIHLAAPAGKNSDACDSIAGPSKALSVGASTIGEGLFLKLGQIRSPKESATTSGTIEAAAHVAGLLAYLVSMDSEQKSPEDMQRYVLRHATKNALSRLPEQTSNLLAFNNATI